MKTILQGTLLLLAVNNVQSHFSNYNTNFPNIRSTSYNPSSHSIANYPTTNTYAPVSQPSQPFQPFPPFQLSQPSQTFQPFQPFQLSQPSQPFQFSQPSQPSLTNPSVGVNQVNTSSSNPVISGTTNPAIQKFLLTGTAIEKVTLDPKLTASGSDNAVYISHNMQFNDLLAQDAGYSKDSKDKPLSYSGNYGYITDPTLLKIIGINTPSAVYQESMQVSGKYYVMPNNQVIQKPNTNFR